MLSDQSTKVGAVLSKMPSTPLATHCKQALKDQQLQLESLRAEIRKTLVTKKIKIQDLKKVAVKAAKKLKDATEVMRISKVRTV